MYLLTLVVFYSIHVYFNSGGVHQPEPKCHIDLRFQLFHPWGGYIRSHSYLLQVFQSWNEMLVFGLCSTSDDWPGWLMALNPIHYPLQPKKWNAHFWITFNFWWSAGLVNGLEPHPPPLSSQKMKCSFLDYIQFLMIGRAGQWTQTPSATPLQPKKWNAHFWITFNFWWSAGLVDGLEPHPLPSPAKKMKCSFLDYIELLMIGWAGQWTRTPSTTPLQPKNEMLIFGLHSISDDRPGWSIDLNPICHPSPVKKWNACFWITFNFWWLAEQSEHESRLKCDKRPPKSTNNEMLIFGLHSTSDDWPCNPSNKSQLKCRKRPPKSLRNEILISILYSTSDDQPSNPSDENWSKCKKNDMLFQLGSSVVSVWVFCTPPPPPMAR